MIVRSVDYAKEAVSMDPKDGISWSVLGNAYLCQYFACAQLPQTLKSALSAYKQAWNDAIARGTPDLPYNKGIVSIIWKTKSRIQNGRYSFKVTFKIFKKTKYYLKGTPTTPHIFSV